MRILDDKNKRVINSIVVMLTEKEAKELSQKLAHLDPKIGDHNHVHDLAAKEKLQFSFILLKIYISTMKRLERLLAMAKTDFRIVW